MITDRTQVIQHSYNLKDFDAANEVMQVFRKFGIERYVYEIGYREPALELGVVMKYGRSMGGTRSPGERLYRQLANAPGWDSAPRSPSGKDFEMICDDFTVKHKRIPYKDHLYFKIYDMTNYSISKWDNEFAIVAGFEAELIQAHVEFYGTKPLGNLKDEIAAIDKLVNHSNFARLCNELSSM